jgi:hypothetical protein
MKKEILEINKYNNGNVDLYVWRLFSSEGGLLATGKNSYSIKSAYEAARFVLEENRVYNCELRVNTE